MKKVFLKIKNNKNPNDIPTNKIYNLIVDRSTT